VKISSVASMLVSLFLSILQPSARALCLLPSYAVVSGGRHVGFGLGMGVFDFNNGAEEDGRWSLQLVRRWRL
jgi:hypothetical protein